MFTAEEISAAKAALSPDGHHEHDDCVRIAGQWLSAQKRVKRPYTRGWARPLKHIIEAWGGRYVSQADVEVAAHLLGLKGEYPRFDISMHFVRPSQNRLVGIGEAMKHASSYSDKYSLEETYASVEAQ